MVNQGENLFWLFGQPDRHILVVHTYLVSLTTNSTTTRHSWRGAPAQPTVCDRIINNVFAVAIVSCGCFVMCVPSIRNGSWSGTEVNYTYTAPEPTLALDHHHYNIIVSEWVSGVVNLKTMRYERWRRSDWSDARRGWKEGNVIYLVQCLDIAPSFTGAVIGTPARRSWWGSQTGSMEYEYLFWGLLVVPVLLNSPCS